MPLKPHPTDPDKMVYVKAEYDMPKPWVGLTDDERKLVRNSVGYNQFMTAGEYAELVQKATESLLKAKND